MDANNGIYSIAYAIVDVESKGSSIGFFWIVIRRFEDRRWDGLEFYIGWATPQAEHSNYAWNIV